MLEKKPVAKESIARRRARWEKCKYSASFGSRDLLFRSSIYCCTNSNIGLGWQLEKWQEFIIRVKGGFLTKQSKLDSQAQLRFGTTDVYVLNPEANFIECERCSEYKPKRRFLIY